MFCSYICLSYIICAKSFKSSNIVELHALYDVFQVDEHIRTPLCMKPWFYFMVLGWDVDLETSSVISELNSAIALLRQKMRLRYSAQKRVRMFPSQHLIPEPWFVCRFLLKVGCSRIYTSRLIDKTLGSQHLGSTHCQTIHLRRMDSNQFITCRRIPSPVEKNIKKQYSLS